MDATSGDVNETRKQNSTEDIQMVESPGNQSLIWVAAQERGIQNLYKERLEGNTCQAVKALNEWYKARVKAWKWLILKWLLCQRIAVYIGTLEPLDPNTTVAYPHKTCFKTLHRYQLLSESFHNPDTLVDVPNFLSSDPSFRADGPDATAIGHPGCDRSVLLLRYELDRKLLALSLSVVITLTLAISIGVGLIEHGVEVAASIFGGVLGSMALLVVYLKWLLK